MKAALLKRLRRYFMAGLLVWVPLGVTYLAFRFLFEVMDKLTPLVPEGLRPDAWLGFAVPGFGLLVAVVVLLLTGVLVANFIGRRLVGWWEDLLNRIPLVRTLYSGVKGFTETLVSSSGESFNKVVLVEYPRREAWSIAFVTASDLPGIDAHTGQTMACVFVPTTPNPTSGFIFMVPQSQLVELDMSVDAAMKMIVTLGVVVPPSIRPVPPAAETLAV